MFVPPSFLLTVRKHPFAAGEDSPFETWLKASQEVQSSALDEGLQFFRNLTPIFMFERTAYLSPDSPCNMHTVFKVMQLDEETLTWKQLGSSERLIWNRLERNKRKKEAQQEAAPAAAPTAASTWTPFVDSVSAFFK